MYGGISVRECPHPSFSSFKGFLSHFLIAFRSTWCQQLSELLSFSIYPQARKRHRARQCKITSVFDSDLEELWNEEI